MEHDDTEGHGAEWCEEVAERGLDDMVVDDRPHVGGPVAGEEQRAEQDRREQPSVAQHRAKVLPTVGESRATRSSALPRRSHASRSTRWHRRSAVDASTASAPPTRSRQRRRRRPRVLLLVGVHRGDATDFVEYGTVMDIVVAPDPPSAAHEAAAWIARQLRIAVSRRARHRWRSAVGRLRHSCSPLSPSCPCRGQ